MYVHSCKFETIQPASDVTKGRSFKVLLGSVKDVRSREYFILDTFFLKFLMRTEHDLLVSEMK